MDTHSHLAPATAVDRAGSRPISCTASDLAAAVAACPTIIALAERLDELLAIVRGRAKSHYTVDEVAAMTGRAPFTVRRWIKEGRLIATRIAGTGPKGRLLVAREDVQRLIESGLGADVRAIDVAP